MLRRATVQDVAVVVDLRAAMFATMGYDDDPHAPWRDPATRWLATGADGTTPRTTRPW